MELKERRINYSTVLVDLLVVGAMLRFGKLTLRAYA